MWSKIFLWSMAMLPLTGLLGCVNKKLNSSESYFQNKNFKTENIVVVVIDGSRYADTWGMQQQPNVPLMAHKLLPEGSFFTNFKNKGRTITVAGHTAIVTGNYQPISNDGTEFPKQTSFFHRYLEQTGKASSKACMITSKQKLKILSKTKDNDWQDKFVPDMNCGNEGSERDDMKTFQEAIATFTEKQPNLTLIQFRGPDFHGHENNWKGYVNSLQETDSLVYELWRYLQQDEFYKDKTALLVTNDHGRHSDRHFRPFKDHGDGCKGCRHISLLALGPDFEQGRLVTEEYEQIDIAPTVGALLGFDVPSFDGGTLILPLLQGEAYHHSTLTRHKELE